MLGFDGQVRIDSLWVRQGDRSCSSAAGARVALCPSAGRRLWVQPGPQFVPLAFRWQRMRRLCARRFLPLGEPTATHGRPANSPQLSWSLVSPGVLHLRISAPASNLLVGRRPRKTAHRARRAGGGYPSIRCASLRVSRSAAGRRPRSRWRRAATQPMPDRQRLPKRSGCGRCALPARRAAAAVGCAPRGLRAALLQTAGASRTHRAIVPSALRSKPGHHRHLFMHDRTTRHRAPRPFGPFESTPSNQHPSSV